MAGMVSTFVDIARESTHVPSPALALIDQMPNSDLLYTGGGLIPSRIQQTYVFKL